MTTFWVARDEDGTLWLYNEEKPRKNIKTGNYVGVFSVIAGLPEKHPVGNNLTWEDEPRKVALYYPEKQVVVDKNKYGRVLHKLASRERQEKIYHGRKSDRFLFADIFNIQSNSNFFVTSCFVGLGPRRGGRGVKFNATTTGTTIKISSCMASGTFLKFIYVPRTIKSKLRKLTEKDDRNLFINKPCLVCTHYLSNEDKKYKPQCCFCYPYNFNNFEKLNSSAFIHKRK